MEISYLNVSPRFFCLFLENITIICFGGTKVFSLSKRRSYFIFEAVRIFSGSFLLLKLISISRDILPVRISAYVCDCLPSYSTFFGLTSFINTLTHYSERTVPILSLWSGTKRRRMSHVYHFSFCYRAGLTDCFLFATA